MSATPTYVQISEAAPLPDIRNHAPFRAVVILAAEYSPEWQQLVSAWLVEGGCLYMSAWGPSCTRWDDSVDRAHIDEYPDGAPDDKLVVTTWHADESLEEVFWFARVCAAHPTRELSTLIVDVSAVCREEEMLARFAAAQNEI